MRTLLALFAAVAVVGLAAVRCEREPSAASVPASVPQQADGERLALEHAEAGTPGKRATTPEHPAGASDTAQPAELDRSAVEALALSLAPGAEPSASRVLLEVEALLARGREQLEALGAQFYALDDWDRIAIPTARGRIVLDVSTRPVYSAIEAQFHASEAEPGGLLGTSVVIDCDLNEVQCRDVFAGEGPTLRAHGWRGYGGDLIDPEGVFGRIAGRVRELSP